MVSKGEKAENCFIKDIFVFPTESSICFASSIYNNRASSLLTVNHCVTRKKWLPSDCLHDTFRCLFVDVGERYWEKDVDNWMGSTCLESGTNSDGWFISR